MPRPEGYRRDPYTELFTDGRGNWLDREGGQVDPQLVAWLNRVRGQEFGEGGWRFSSSTPVNLRGAAGPGTVHAYEIGLTGAATAEQLAALQQPNWWASGKFDLSKMSPARRKQLGIDVAGLPYTPYTPPTPTVFGSQAQQQQAAASRLQGMGLPYTLPTSVPLPGRSTPASRFPAAQPTTSLSVLAGRAAGSRRQAPTGGLPTPTTLTAQPWRPLQDPYPPRRF